MFKRFNQKNSLRIKAKIKFKIKYNIKKQENLKIN
jgi:hypothetical protein